MIFNGLDIGVTDIKEYFAAELTRLMARDDVTQEQFAASMEVSQATVSDWRNRKNLPRLERLEAIAKFFKVTVASLVGPDLASLIPADVLKIAEFVTTLPKDHWAFQALADLYELSQQKGESDKKSDTD